MESFRRLAEHFLVKAEELCDDLMFGLNPVIDFAKVKDDLTNTQYGFSFVQHPSNKLADAYLDLSTKACTTRRNGLFRSDQTPDKPWDSSRLTSILKKATTEAWKTSANTQLYRQLTIGITEKHVHEVHKPFNRFDDKSAAADVNVVFAWQSGHRPIQRAMTYGLDGAFPAKLQPALLRVYEWASTRWHEFLHQPSKVMIAETARSLSPAHRPSSRIPDIRPTKRRILPWDRDELQKKTPAKRRAIPRRQDPPRADNVLLAQHQAEFPGAHNQVSTTAKRPAHPADIIVRVEAWQDGAAKKPVSDDEGDSPIDWDEPDMIPSTVSNKSLRSWSRAPWPSWSRHNRRTEAKIDKARQFHGVFDIKELRQYEQIVMRDLKRCLDLWSQCYIVCDVKGNPGGHHSTQDCPDRLYRIVQTWASAFQARLQRLAGIETQHCPVCLVPRLICDCWSKGEPKKWVETGMEC
jgi:hypothetical protein